MTATINVRPFDTHVGAEVNGIDLRRPLDDATVASLYQIFLDHQILCIRNQNLNPQQFEAALSRFGTPTPLYNQQYRLEGVDCVSVISNVENKDIHGEKEGTLIRGQYWHTDESYLSVPCKATSLYAVVIPEKGGNTRYINTYKVLEDMPADLRARIEGRKARHVYRSRRAGAYVAARNEDEKKQDPGGAYHPMVRTHPETNRQALYINPNRIDLIEDWDEANSDELLDELYEFAFQDRFQYHHEWQVGDLIIWDNRCLMHAATADYEGERKLYRISLEGTVPE